MFALLTQYNGEITGYSQTQDFLLETRQKYHSSHGSQRMMTLNQVVKPHACIEAYTSIFCLFSRYSYTHKLVVYGGFIHLYISIDVVFMNAEEDTKISLILKVPIIVCSICSEAIQTLAHVQITMIQQ